MWTIRCVIRACPKKFREKSTRLNLQWQPLRKTKKSPETHCKNEVYARELGLWHKTNQEWGKKLIPNDIDTTNWLSLISESSSSEYEVKNTTVVSNLGNFKINSEAGTTLSSLQARLRITESLANYTCTFHIVYIKNWSPNCLLLSCYFITPPSSLSSFVYRYHRHILSLCWIVSKKRKKECLSAFISRVCWWSSVKFVICHFLVTLFFWAVDSIKKL